MSRRSVVLGLALLGLAAARAGAAEVVLRFPDLSGDGPVTYAVFATAATWKSNASPVAAGNAATTHGAAAVTLDLPPGAYAVMAYQDRDRNGRINVLPIGLPTEPYGFSNNARATFGPPSFAASAFTAPAAGTRLSIRLR